jgi:hypothetical protein
MRLVLMHTLETTLVRLSKVALVAAITLGLSMAAFAQGNTSDDVQNSEGTAGTVSTVTFAPPEPAAAQGPYSSFHGPAWQIAFGEQFNGMRLYNSEFYTNGFNVSLTRYFGSLFGVEVQTGAGFGNTHSATAPPNLSAKSVFVGGGPRLSVRNPGHIEPWAHGIVGLEHFQFTQTSTLGSNSTVGWEAGGGVDIHASVRTAFRLEGDYLGTRFFALNHRNYQVVSGIVFNF